MKIKKLLLVLVLLLLFVLVGCSEKSGPSDDPITSSEDEVYTIVFGNSGSDQVAHYNGTVAMKEYVEKESNGKLKMEIYMNAQLGNDRELIESVQTGAVGITVTGLTQFTNFVQELVALDQPFLFDNTEQVIAFFNNTDIQRELEGYFEAAGLKYLGSHFQGFRTLTSNRRVTTPKDVKGMSIRVIESPTPLAIWNALGASPTPISFAEVYTSLQQGVVEAQENPIELISSQRFYEQQKYMIDTNHQIQPNFWVVNPDFYNKLPAGLQKIFDEGIEKALEISNRDTLAQTEEYINIIKGFGCELINITDDSRAEFKELTAGVRQDVSDQYPEFSKVINEVLDKIK